MRELPAESLHVIDFVPDEFTKKGGIWLLRTGENIANPNYHIEKIIHYYSFHYVLDGKVEFVFNHERIILGKGDMFCLFPNVVYQYQYHALADKPLRLLWLSFDGEQAITLINRAGLMKTSPYLKQVMTKELHHALKQLFVPPAEGFKRQLELHSLLLRIFSCMMPPDEIANPLSDSTEWIHKSIEYMKTHYMDRITVQDVAAYISVHRSYFSKVFTQQVGVTPTRYLIRLKMEKAAELLRSSAFTINEVSLLLGFSDQYAFNRAFHKFHGLPPGKWRKI